MLGFTALALFVLAIGEIRDGRLATGLVLGLLAVAISGVAASIGG
jgi:hypothetical protein